MIPDWISAKVRTAVYDTGGATAGPPVQGHVHAISTGPAVLQNSNGTLVGYVWLARYDLSTASLMLSRAVDSQGSAWGPEIKLCTIPKPVSSVSLSFDQTGNAVVAIGYADDTVAVFWYNPETESNELRYVGAGSTPVVGIDNLRNTGKEDTELVMFLVRADTVYRRQQADRWEVETAVGITGRNVKLKSCGMRTDFRFGLKVAAAEVYTWPVPGVVEGGVTPFSVSASYDVIGDDRSSLTLQIPAHLDGDTLVLVVHYRNDIPATPAGWTFVGSYISLAPTQGYATHIAVYSRLAVGVVPSVTVTKVTSGRFCGMLFAVNRPSFTVEQFERTVVTAAPYEVIATASDTVAVFVNLLGTSAHTVTGGAVIVDGVSVSSYKKLGAVWSAEPTTYSMLLSSEQASSSDSPNIGCVLLKFA